MRFALLWYALNLGTYFALIKLSSFYLDCDVDHYLDQKILFRITLDLDRDLDNLNPNKRWIAMHMFDYQTTTEQ